MEKIIYIKDRRTFDKILFKQNITYYKVLSKSYILVPRNANLIERLLAGSLVVTHRPLDVVVVVTNKK